ncbi:hypothetical protein VitviT2T_014154 [Vitis vinifera]|uniref:N-acetyltransferase domain-containing protein n=2 Tax=Vitis vinifera TaxID=29760 RepID=A0ABY9CL36_VITVI|eukprot:XP_002264353.1 PREDICTED: probable N-acetyltransferase HLS1 isoform X1 [Vitis vinifera]
MSQRVAAETCPPKVVVVREFDEGRDKAAVEEMEKRCEIGQRGKPSLVTDLMGDPICRIRHFSTHVMLVAEYGEERRVVGVVRGCVKTVTRGKSMYVKVAYILGLRVCPAHRRLGIGTKLVQHLEKWCERNGAEYAYMATDCTNEPSINLFTKKCSYAKFRTPTMLVQPVHAHYKPLPSSKTLILPLPPQLAELIYRRIFANSEFFPKDIDQILTNKLNLGTFIALPKKSNFKCNPSNNNNNLLLLPPTFAILSVWNTKDVFKLQLKGASPLTYAWCAGTRALDAYLPWLHFPSIPNVFKQFGVYFLHGLHMEGKHGLRLMKSLCAFAHNMARDDAGCGALVAEVAHRDPVRDGIPHWSKFSWAEDLWCIKKFTPANHHPDDDWVTSRPASPVIFVDPRDF